LIIFSLRLNKLILALENMGGGSSVYVMLIVPPLDAVPELGLA